MFYCEKTKIGESPLCTDSIHWVFTKLSKDKLTFSFNFYCYGNTFCYSFNLDDLRPYSSPEYQVFLRGREKGKEFTLALFVLFSSCPPRIAWFSDYLVPCTVLKGQIIMIIWLALFLIKIQATSNCVSKTNTCAEQERFIWCRTFTSKFSKLFWRGSCFQYHCKFESY